MNSVIDLGDLLETVLPLLFFLMWVVISIVAASLKKKKEQSGAPKQPQQEQKESRGLSGDLRQSLESVFGPLYEEQEEVEEQDDAYRDYKSDTPAQKAEPALSKPVKKTSPVTSAYYDKRKTFPTAKSGAYERDKNFPQARDDAWVIRADVELAKASREDLVKAVIWSEILQPPLSLRE